MKRYGNIMDRILTYDNLAQAFHNAAKGKADRKDVVSFRAFLSTGLNRLQKQIRDNTIEFGRYSFFTVHDPKTRNICAASFEERVVHHALMNICGPILDHSQIFHSYACRKGKGQHRALGQACTWAGSDKFYLKMDVSKFFDSIDHNILKQQLEMRFKDQRVLSLFFSIIDSYHTQPGKGVPLGNLTSQYFANYYLNRFDLHMIQEEKAGAYLRYMDDILIFGDKSKVCRLRQISREYLQFHLELKLKKGGQINRTEKGIGFLGAVVYPGKLRMSARAKKRINAKIKTVEKGYQSGQLSDIELQQRTSALWAGLFRMNCHGWRAQLAKDRIDA